MKLFAYFILFNLFSIINVNGAEPYYHKVTALRGDGVYSLLRRYELADEYCNVLKFYQLNNLQKEEKLFEGKKYFLPILIYHYNGSSIRSTIGSEDWDKAVKIQEYNEKLVKNNLRTSSYQSSKLLWVPFSSIYCGKSTTKDETTPKTIDADVIKKEEEENKITNNETVLVQENYPSTDKIMKTFTLFGKEFENYQEIDQSLKNKVFYLVSGHGGPDPGAMCTTCPHNLCEDEYAYDVILRLARNLKQHGAVVEVIIQDDNDGIRTDKYLPCDSDEKCNGKSLPFKQKKRLQQRADYINELHVQYKNKGYKDHTVVAIHVDAAGEGDRKDVFFYHHANSKTGERLANNIQTTFEEKYDTFQKGRGYKGTVKARGLYMINHTNPPIVYIELANIHNPKDQQRIMIDTNRQALANWIFQGLLR